MFMIRKLQIYHFKFQPNKNKMNVVYLPVRRWGYTCRRWCRRAGRDWRTRRRRTTPNDPQHPKKWITEINKILIWFSIEEIIHEFENLLEMTFTSVSQVWNRELFRKLKIKYSVRRLTGSLIILSIFWRLLGNITTSRHPKSTFG